jgi:HK97 family phage prohead protease
MEKLQANKLLGVPEWRGIDDYEVRSQGDEFIVRGYASLFDSPYPVGGGPDAGGWLETVDRRAFDVTLGAKPDVHFLINHEGVTLARTKSGTLNLATDSKGLIAEARIDRRDPAGASLEVKMQRGDLDEMSFAFRTVRQSWNDDYTDRRLVEVNIDKGDVSVVNNGANEQTNIRITDTRSLLAAVAGAELAEVRKMDDPAAALREARARIDQLIRDVTPGKHPLSVAEALRVIEGRA